jgi:segregation and condensation protein A
MKRSQEYAVKLDAFEGPLDLLLYLINRAEVSILDISVSAITRQYLDYLDLIRELNINVASEYLSMAATLLRLKAREILPQQDDEALDEEEDCIVTREQLIQKLLEYKKFKEAAHSLRICEAEQIGSFTRGRQEEIELLHDEAEAGESTVTIFDLISAFQRILDRGAGSNEMPARTIEPEEVKLDDKIEYILGFLESDSEVLFETFFAHDRRRMVMVVTFMAFLELIKMQRIGFRQEEAFGAIFVKRKTPPAQPAAYEAAAPKEDYDGAGTDTAE